MHRSLIGTALVLAALRNSLAAQASDDSLTRRQVLGGLSVVLPASWRPLSDSTRESIKRIEDTLFPHVRDTLLQASLKNGRPITLLHERAPGHLDPSASLNAAPAPGTRASSFSSVSPSQVAAVLAPLCNAMRAVVAQMGARLISCDPAVTDQAAGRTIAVTRLVRSGREGFVTVWLAQFPDRDVVYTLTLAAPQAEESQYQPLFRTIWRSVVIPPN
jgi:hypothetical protein